MKPRGPIYRELKRRGESFMNLPFNLSHEVYEQGWALGKRIGRFVKVIWLEKGSLGFRLTTEYPQLVRCEGIIGRFLSKVGRGSGSGCFFSFEAGYAALRTLLIPIRSPWAGKVVSSKISCERSHATMHDGQIITVTISEKELREEGTYATTIVENVKGMVVSGCIWRRKFLDAEAEAFLADVECTAPYDHPLAITTTNMFEVSHEDAYDSDVDEGPHAAAAFMANLSSTSGTIG
ncbi:hypothetical protein Tco_0799560 [Tanacetum coccineum]|uniref:Uncharacterized protein n=1 Tax=Tanacetum coccineum TaxID=301880 RepID=A0ABQ4ZUH8_9ASTR